MAVEGKERSSKVLGRLAVRKHLKYFEEYLFTISLEEYKMYLVSFFSPSYFVEGRDAPEECQRLSMSPSLFPKGREEQ